MYNGRAAMVQCEPTTGARAFAFLNHTFNPTQGGGGLLNHWVVRGTTRNDTMVVVTDPLTTPCGDPLQPLLFNGYGVLLRGGSGDDTLYSGTTPRLEDSVTGGNGNDWLMPPPGGIADGERNHDRLFGWGVFSETEALYGGRDDDGSDTLCEWASNVAIWQMDGGPGLDAHCGFGFARHINLEWNSCAICQ
jgi:hypothetical protein